ncbi:retroviral-like aspartic protease family protein [Altererythrobacter arenosus]|uniref:Retroviral-like aspartic protease family protein n=1 Tax=Altererythrobacter arenosus TaxID=3032592 RepID=A0ABY8FVF9_9SPHN|nr:retroviral-like aspartic protease family protein [Altererythrobacter sp. CAU 1644]WFL78235.1 retroviral-like aspartic protease family protein [Altererythrobacter sp. CAU 1644]
MTDRNHLLARMSAFLAALAISAQAAPAVAQSDKDEQALPPSQVRELPPAHFDETLAIGGEEIDARKVSSRMTVEVKVNGEGPYKFVVDSGADTSVVGERIAARLGLPDAQPVMLQTMTERKVVDRVEVDSLKLGPTTTTDLLLPVLDERNIGAEGMIGLDALVRQRLMLDFDKRIITVEDGLVPAIVRPNEIVVTARLKRGQLILTEVRALGQKVEAVIDTGTEVTIGNLALRDKLRRRHAKSFKTIEIYGVTGATATLDFAIVPLLKLGPVTFQNVPIAFADVSPFELFGLAEKPALLLGTDLMETFRRVSLDFHERKVRFQLKRCRARATMIRTTTHVTRLGSDTDTACDR